MLKYNVLFASGRIESFYTLDLAIIYCKAYNGTLLTQLDPITETTKVVENKTTLFKSKRRSSLRIRFMIFANNPIGGSIKKFSIIN